MHISKCAENISKCNTLTDMHTQAGTSCIYIHQLQELLADYTSEAMECPCCGSFPLGVTLDGTAMKMDKSKTVGCEWYATNKL